MSKKEKLISWKDFVVKSGKKIKLADFATGYEGKELTKQESEGLLSKSRKKLCELEEVLYANNRYSILIILQAMDAAGKDGAVKHIMSGINPAGVKVYSFKVPNALELDHDFLWRHALAMPARGEIAIHNRSHYENVLVTRVHPEYILKENIPGIDSLKKINDKFWESRFKQIHRFEKNLADNGTVILKFFLHLSKKEQKKRFLERLDDPSKNWKFEPADLKERGFWDEYQNAYENAISKTSEKHSPWFIIPADDKWFARLAIASLIVQKFSELELTYPILSKEHKEELTKAKGELAGEK